MVITWNIGNGQWSSPHLETNIFDAGSKRTSPSKLWQALMNTTTRSFISGDHRCTPAHETSTRSVVCVAIQIPLCHILTFLVAEKIASFSWDFTSLWATRVTRVGDLHHPILGLTGNFSDSKAWKSLGVLPRRWRWTFHVPNLETSSLVSCCSSITYVIFAVAQGSHRYFFRLFSCSKPTFLGFISGRVLLLNPWKRCKRTALLASMAWLLTLSHLQISTSCDQSTL